VPIPVRARLAEDFSSIEQFSLHGVFPDQEGTAVGITPTAITTTLARVFPFYVPETLVVNQVLVKQLAAVTTGYIFGVFDRTGARVWTSGAVSTTGTGWLAITASLPITLTAGTYYFAVTNNNTVSAVAGIAGSSALVAATPPRWGTVPATAGAMPASITPTAITETVGGWPIYVVLSNWTT
jgi:hypothetical protein